MEIERDVIVTLHAVIPTFFNLPKIFAASLGLACTKI